MKNISSALVSDKNRLASDRAWMIALQVQVIDPATNSLVETLRLIRNDESSVIDGESYQPFPFEFEIEERDGLPTVGLTIQDQTQAIQQRMEDYGGGVGFKVIVMAVSGVDAATIDAEPELTEEFQVLSASIADYVVSWQLGVPNPLNSNFPRRRQFQDQCSFRYKGTECGYTGAIESCDLTLTGVNGCGAHDNSNNYGGLPGVKIRGG
jgi:phage-related protein